jgi:hypothetical protein
MAMFERAISKALVEPSIGQGEDQIQLGHIPMPDFVHLGTAIISAGGVNAEASREVRPLSETASS